MSPRRRSTWSAACAWLFVAALGLAQPAAQAQQTGWSVTPREREVGEVFEVSLQVAHAATERIECDATALELDPSWIVDRGPLRTPLRDADGRLVGTRLVWTLASLEPGERSLPPVAVTRIDGAGRRSSLELDAVSARFVGVLAPGEDEPRAPLGFRALGEETASARLGWALAALAAAIVAGAFVVLRARRRTRPPSEPTVFERLAELEAREVETRDDARELYYELTALVRGAVDRRLGVVRSALADREWLASLEGPLPADLVRELAAVLRESEPVKYAGAHPTHWAARELLARSRRVLEALDGARRAAA